MNTSHRSTRSRDSTVLTCGVYANQVWWELIASRGSGGEMTGVWGRKCSYCGQWAIWVGERLVERAQGGSLPG